MAGQQAGIGVATFGGEEVKTEGMTYHFAPNGKVQFNHKVFGKLPDDELLRLAQLNENPPSNLMGEIARRGLQRQFSDLWEAGIYCPNN